MRVFLLLIALTGCGGDNSKRDAPDGGAADAATIDAIKFDCATYCDKVRLNCMGTNAQYPDDNHCLAACDSFAMGTVTDVSGNTLGCRNFYAGAPAQSDPATSCPYAGPAGDPIATRSQDHCSGGDICASFCTLQLKACGSLDTPLPGDPLDGSNNHLYKYQNMTDCMNACADFDQTHAYGTGASGNSLACRLLHATNAATTLDNAKIHCAHTAPRPTGPCAGGPTP